MAFTRPVRGATRIDGLKWDTRQLKAEILSISDDEWKDLDYGVRWSDISLLERKSDGSIEQHPFLRRSLELQKVLESFPGTVVDMCLAMLEGGGSVKEHRDISGGSTAGIVRIHIPVVTNRDVEFLVSGKPVNMAEGEVWVLDTTYRHSVANRSQETRIHLIVDIRDNAEIRRLLPKRDLRDHLHTCYFWLVCVGKAAQLSVTDPRQLLSRARSFFNLRVLGASSLHSARDSKDAGA